jgi:hypothetical protein
MWVLDAIRLLATVYQQRHLQEKPSKDRETESVDIRILFGSSLTQNLTLLLNVPFANATAIHEESGNLKKEFK